MGNVVLRFLTSPQQTFPQIFKVLQLPSLVILWEQSPIYGPLEQLLKPLVIWVYRHIPVTITDSGSPGCTLTDNVTYL